MKTFKRLTAILLSMFMLIPLIPVSAIYADQAAEDISAPPAQDNAVISSGSYSDSVFWTLDTQGTLTITGEGRVGQNSDTSIKEHVKKLVIEEGITQIESRAFSGYTLLASVELPETVGYIEEYAFYGCVSLTEITIPDSVYQTGMYAFSNCTSLKKVTFKDISAERMFIMSWGTFYGCTSLESIVLPEMTDLWQYGFYGCSSLKSIVLSKRDDAVPASFFSGCTSLESVTLNENTKSIYTQAFKDCVSLKSIILNKNVTSIAEDAFEGCTSLVISCPVGSYAESYAIEHNIPYVNEDMSIASGSCSDSVSWVLDESKVLTISGEGPMTVESAPWAEYASIIESVVIEDGVTSLCKGAFENCVNITTVSIPQGIEVIPENAFKNCVSLDPSGFKNGMYLGKMLVLPESVKMIEDSAFEGCVKLGGVSGDGVESVGSSAFKGCSALSSASFNNAKIIGDYAFKDCSLTSAGINSCVSIGAYAFEGSSLGVIFGIPESVTEIGEGAFKNCRNLQVVFLYSPITELPDSIFEGCTNLISFLSDTNHIEKIGNRAFYGCSALTTPLICEDTLSIGESAYEGCTALGEIEMYDSITFIGENAFKDCPSLKFKCSKGSYAEGYAIANGITYADSVEIIASGSCEGETVWTLDSKGVLRFSGQGNIYGTGESDVAPWKEYISQVKTVIIEEGIEIIRPYSFKNHTALTEVHIAEGVSVIGVGAFYGCTALKSVIIPNSVDAIPESCFDGCSALESVEIGSGVTRIGPWAFYKCVALEEIVIPDNVTRIEQRAFSSCTGLKNVTMGGGVVYMGSMSFAGSDAIENFYINDLSAWCAINFIDNYTPVYYTDNLFINGELTTELVIPDDVTKINMAAFYGCKPITKLVLGKNVKSVGGMAFYGCDSLVDIIIPASLESVAGYAFVCGVKNVYISDLAAWFNISFTNESANPLYYAQNLYINGELTTEITLPESVTEIKNYAFCGFAPITAVTLHEGVTAIGIKAFMKAGITSIDIPDSVTTLGEYAFNRCESLVSANLPNGIETVSAGLFGGCIKLENISIPASVKKIDEYAFNRCRAFTDIVIPEGVTEIGTRAFEGCVSMASITLPEGLVTIGDDALHGCGLTSIYIPASVESMDSYPFFDCNELTEINVAEDNKYYSSHLGVLYNKDKTILIEFPDKSSITEYVLPEGVLKINGYAFNRCSTILSIKLADSVTEIGFEAFSHCGDLHTVYISKDISKIGSYAFYYCFDLENIYIHDLADWCRVELGNTVSNPFNESGNKYLYINGELAENIEFPEGIETVPNSLFRNCISIKAVTIPDGVSAIGSYAFGGCRNLTDINIPDSVTAIGSGAFEFCSSLTDIPEAKGVTKIDNYTFKYCYGLVNVTVPSNITEIGEHAFYECKNLTSITIPDSVTSIAEDCFYNSKLVNIYCTKGSYAESYAIEHNIPYEYIGSVNPSGGCGDNVVWSISEDNILTLSGQGRMKDYSEDIPAPWLKYSERITAVVLEDGVMNVGKYAFCGCAYIESVNLGSAADSIGISAFEGCVALAEIDIPEALTSIGGSAFEGCSLLKNIAIPENVVYIGYRAFYNCSSIESIVIPEGVTEILGDTFRNCKGLVSVKLHDNITEIGTYAFQNCISLKEIKLPDNLTYLGWSAFDNCDLLTEVTIPGGVKQILNSAFGSCNSLKKVTISDGVIYIGFAAFSGCTSLENVNIPESVTEIDGRAFRNCSSLKELIIPESVTLIDSDSFEGCSSLTLVCHKGSYAEGYAVENGINYRILPYVSSDGVILTVHGLEGAKDFLIAKGEHTTYREVKNNLVTLVTNAKFGDTGEYTYWLSDYGVYTVYIRYTDSSWTPVVLKTELTGIIPELEVNGLRLTVKNLEGVKVIRTAYGDYNTAGEIKRAEGSRSVSGSRINSDSYTIQYRENGLVSVAVVYENGYTQIFKHEIKKHTPEFVQNGNTVTIGNLDNLQVIRYVKGEYSTSAEIKRAPGCVNTTASGIKEGLFTVTLEPGVYSFCVQYNDESYNYYVITVE